MYLTGGQFKGLKIEIPKSARPTLSKVRQSVFNMLNQFELDNNYFLDMFAGSALMGLEALSRGFRVKEIEIDKKAIEIIKKNYSKTKIKPDYVLKDALKFQDDILYDVIYIDPPWNKNYEKIILKADSLLKNNGIIILEHDNQINFNFSEMLKEKEINLQIFKEKKYGRTLITILTRKN